MVHEEEEILAVLEGGIVLAFDIDLADLAFDIDLADLAFDIDLVDLALIIN